MALDPSLALGYRPPQVNVPVPQPLEQFGQILSLRNMMTQGQVGQLELQTRMRELQQKADIDQAYKNALTINPDGTAEIDTGKLTQALGQAGHGSVIPGILKGVQDFQRSGAELNKLNSEVAEKNADFLGNVGAVLKQANYDPNLFLLKGKQAIAGKYLPSAMAQPYIDQVTQSLQQDPTGNTARQLVKTLSDQFIAGSPAQQKLINEAVTAQARQTQAETAAERFKIEKPGLVTDAAQKVRTDDASMLAAAASRGKDALAGALATLPADRQQPFLGLTDRDEIIKAGLPGYQRLTVAQTAATAAETARHNLSTESTAKLNTAISQGRLDQEKLINGMKYGPGTQEYWVQQLAENPDSIKEMPPELRSSVGQAFKAKTGLPLPTLPPAAMLTSENAARNALDGITFIKNALQNPEIQKQIGPIMGRLGNAEQAVGTAVGLSPQAAQLAQELRTRMRYFVFQEGKAILGGRLPQKLMEALESSSANVKMDSNMLQGALNGAEGNAQSVLDNVDKQRFGGKMRSREMRGTGLAPAGDGAAPPGSTPGMKVSSPGAEPRLVWYGPDGKEYSKPPVAQGPATHRYNPATGKIEAK